MKKPKKQPTIKRLRIKFTILSGKVSVKQGGAITSRERASLNVAKQKGIAFDSPVAAGTGGDKADLISPRPRVFSPPSSPTPCQLFCFTCHKN